MFKSILRQQGQKNGGKSSAHLLALANDLIAMATEWVKAPADRLAELKTLRSKLGTLPRGLTEKNRALLRRLEDPRLLSRLLNLPDLMWRRARRKSPPSPYWFVDLQTALAIDILLHSPLRIEDLQALKFDEHIHWPQGKGRAALITVRQAKVEDNDLLECELPPYLSDRLYAFRNEIAPDVIGSGRNSYSSRLMAPCERSQRSGSPSNARCCGTSELKLPRISSATSLENCIWMLIRALMNLSGSSSGTARSRPRRGFMRAQTPDERAGRTPT